MPSDAQVLTIYQPGPLTVVGFKNHDMLDRVNVSHLKHEIAEIVNTQRTTVLAFDLTGVRLLPSGLLGLLASLTKFNIEVHVYNPTPDVREVLEITKLDQILGVHDVEL